MVKAAEEALEEGAPEFNKFVNDTIEAKTTDGEDLPWSTKTEALVSC